MVIASKGAVFADGGNVEASKGRDGADRDIAIPDILHLAELVPVVRERLGLGGVSDDVIMTCLKAIAAQSEPRERWRAAFSSRLGEMLSRQGRDLNTALNTLLALLPRLSS